MNTKFRSTSLQITERKRYRFHNREPPPETHSPVSKREKITCQLEPSSKTDIRGPSGH